MCMSRYLTASTFCNSTTHPEATHYGRTLEQRRDAVNIFFSPFRQRQDLSPAEVLQKLWQDFPNSVVLCSMFNPKHITANAQLAEKLS